MKLPFSWIKECIATKLPAGKVADALTMLGLEVEGIDTSPMSFTGVVVGQVVKTERHPDADKLTVAMVSDGQETVQVVCAAPNCREGLITAFAKIGGTLTDPEGKTFKIKKAKLRGVESNGMLCAEDELGLSQSHDGIIEFPVDTVLGTDLQQLYGDAVFDISLTPNLGHCASLQGVLRELAAFLDTSYSLPQVYIDDGDSEQIKTEASVSIEDTTKCPRYACRVIKNVKIAPSPKWLQDRLLQCGLRPINNIVDATNYVLWELGHPLHAFDYDKLAGHKIVVRTAKEDEQFVTLDGQTRKLNTESLLICDDEKPVALAGIMGGQNSEVGDETQNVLLESAYFEPSNIRRTSRFLGLTTEASRRFERAADPNGVITALDRAAVLIQELAGGEIVKGLVDIKNSEFSDRKIVCRLSRIQGIIGQHLAAGEVEGVFRRLGFPCTWDGQELFSIRVPTYRADIHAEIDLIEEVARIYGYDNIERQPAYYHTSTLPHAPIFLFERQSRQRLLSQGLQEFMTCDLIGPSMLDVLPNIGDNPTQVRVLNPTSAEQSILRQSLLPGMLQAIRYNVDRKNLNVGAFEIGRTHFLEGKNFKEQSVVGIILTGKSRPHSWEQHPGPFDFYDLKGIVEDFLSDMSMPSPSFEVSKLSTFHPGRQASVLINGIDVGAIGEVHPDILGRLDVTQRILFAELNLHDLYRLKGDSPKMVELPQFPGSERDWTISLSEKVTCGTVFSLIRQFAPALLEQVSLLDLYRSEKLGSGVKNVTFRFFYRDRTRTVQQEDVDSKHTRLIEKVTTGLGTAVQQQNSAENAL
ncbi:MAG: phenylalanine--tRNA ligase subunit beta [Chlamydiales bacterium]|nr:phenylalanine--tRNA ligase subunit beta [Chlamydiales bacterium]